MTVRGRLLVLLATALLAGCSHATPPLAHGEVVDIAGEHPHLNRASNICTEHEMLCILGGIALLGGVAAALDDD
jgi:hypothetical protein